MTNLGDLEVFVRVIAAGSMSTAARDLGLSPAVVSKRIKRLEDKLGTRLLQRTTRQISLTEAGQGFHERVLSILAGLEEAEAYASGRSSEVNGILKISAPTSFGRLHVAPHLKSFMRAHPDLAIHLVLSDELTDIVGGGFDLAIRIAELTDSSLVAKRLAPVRRLLCASPGYLAEHGIPETIEDLKSHRCLPAHNNDSWRLEGPNGPVTLRPEGSLITNSSEVIREAVIGGLGIALRSTWDVGGELKTGQLVQVLPAYESSRNVALSAVYPSRQFLPAKVRLFIDYLAELYGPVPYWDL
ncbi:LysR family transcriptional regulator [Peteryoungia desertarenae]|uniref:LysR family transcriptional regulator n=1 Tax=Peteryoungia desertarenae TaxID=1813451 RepID=A0ABX6QMF9_9HYPH|nr:LysR family transcriptional regulator [Peteryoungia desertarenae]QLF69496.1 LysR family transcriptional regulator [Peteryoungia desertarenae]